MTRIDLLYFDAGGGHRAAANALKAVIEAQKRPWEIRLVNLQELLDSLDVFRKLTHVRLQDIYNHMLAKGWTRAAPQGLQIVHAIVRLYHRPIVRLLQEHWVRTQPCMVVSLVPNFNRAILQSVHAALPSAPFITILTDFADYPPHFWIERSVDYPQYLICGTEKAVEQANMLGHSPERIFRTSGMILTPQFYESSTMDRAAERCRLGLEPDRPTGLVLFGGHGSKAMLQISRRLPDTQLIFVCGHNRNLAERLKALPAKAPRVVEGFTNAMPYYMRLADFFIGKPGPGSISEAVAMKLPVIVECNAWTLPQERYNAQWVRDHKAGMVVRDFHYIGAAVNQILAKLPEFHSSVEKIHNHAVFEIPEILEKLLQV